MMIIVDKLLGLLVVSVMLLPGCSPGRYIGDSAYDDEVADTTSSQIADALSAKDKSRLKSLFAKDVASVSNFDKEADCLLKHVEGNIVSRELWSAPTVREDIYAGSRTYEVWAGYRVSTEKQDYTVFFINRTSDTSNPDRGVGIRSLQVVDRENEERDFGQALDVTRVIWCGIS